MLEAIHDSIVDAEQRLRSRVGENGASPFLAHHVLEDEHEVRVAVQTSVNGNIGALDRLYRLTPAVAIWSAAKSLAENYGEDGDHACYAHLARTYCFDEELTPDQRVSLRRLFRRAALSLGLPLPAEGEVIKEYGRAALKALATDDFFSQVGVSVHQIKDLAQIFQRAEGAFGAPLADDTTANLVRWERDAVLEFCPFGLRRLPKAILFDWSGYHAGLYARILAGESSDTPFAVALRAAREKLPSPKAQFVPRLVCYDGELGIRDGSSGTGFFARLRSEERHVKPGATLPLTAPWPTSVKCWPPKGDESNARSVEILDSETTFALFDASSGRAVGATDASMSKMTVPHGEVVVVCRESFTVGDRESVEAGVGAHMLYVDVLSPVSLQSRLQKVELIPRPSPSIKFLGASAIGRSGTAQLIAGIHAVEVQFPSGAEESVKGIELHISHPSLAAPRIVEGNRLTVAAQQFSLLDILPSSGDFGLLKIELKQPGVDRVLLRESAWYWPGLRSLNNGATFDASAVPRNYDAARSQHIKVNASGSLEIQPADRSPYLSARLVFSTPGDQEGDREPLAEFTLMPPGVSIVFRELNGKEKPLPHGQTLALSPEDGSAIIIRTSQPAARLDVKGIMEAQSFDRFGVRRMTSRALSGASHGPLEHSEVRYQDPWHPSSWRVLLRIAEVASVVHFVATLSNEVSELTVKLPRTPELLRVRGRGLLYEEEFSLLENDEGLEVNRGEENEPIHISWQTSSLPRADVYVVSLDVDFGDGRWRTLTNARRDRFEVAVRHPQLDDATIEGRAPHAGLASRLTDVLNRCAAVPCWPSIEQHVLPLWQSTITSVSTSTPQDWRLLISAAAAGWDAEASVTWVPIHHPIEVATGVFSAPLDYFKAFDSIENLRGGEPIGWLARFASPDMAAAAMVDQQLDPRFFAAFQNLPELSRDPNARPRGFSFRNFEAFIGATPLDERESLWTPRQGRLTQAHHHWCCERYAERLAEVHVQGHNRHRIDDLRELSLVAAAVGLDLEGAGRINLPCPEHLYAQRKDSDRILIEDVPRILSLLAKHSRFGTPDRLLSAFRSRAPKSRQAILQTFGFLVRLGPELFAFYLLLWELAVRGDDTHA